MAIKIRIPKKKLKRLRSRLGSPVAKILVASFLILCTIALGVFAYFYISYEKIVDKRMRGQIFSNSAKIYARPQVIRPGYALSATAIANHLRRSGYTEVGERGESRIGTYRILGDDIEIRPGPESYHSTDAARISISGGKVERIRSLNGGRDNLAAFELEPQLLTALFHDDQRTKRRLVSYDEIPKVLVDSVIAIEDRRFFQHSGVNPFRFAQAAWNFFWHGSRSQGGSTITMQIARGFFLTPEKTVKRKLTEVLIAFQLEQRFSKKQIFEFYANQVPMGQRGSFAIQGLAEAARSYFNKDIKQLEIEEAALLAGLIQRPSYLNPYKHPQRAMERRNLVLESMFETEAISRQQADKAKAAPLKLAPPNVDASEAPYFVDLVKDTLVARYGETDLNEGAYRVYTSIDPELQAAAAEAVEKGIKEVDEQVRKQRTRKIKTGKGKSAKVETVVRPGPEPQVALVAIDPRTGEVLALVGGRNYGNSQLNHAVAKRPTGSIFKPFVYAAAISTAVEQGDSVITPATLVDDSPTTFIHGDEIYEPRNYKEEYHGPVTARYALALSLNNATVRLAEMVGYERVAELAKAVGIKSVKATPSLALGAYEGTPIEMAAAYTVFANGGTYIAPAMVTSVRDAQGNIIDNFKPEMRPVLDPRVAAVLTNMMEAVINAGTGSTVRARGFSAPAAGKTGTSHDGWFAGFTSNMITVVWIGYDDYSDLRLSGSQTAAPIWAEFMKRAVALPQYKNTRSFSQPSGVIAVRLDKATNRLATSTCPESYVISFVAGTEPHETCDQIASDGRNIFEKLLGIGEPKPLPPQPVSNTTQRQPAGGAPAAAAVPAEPEKKKKGFFGKIFGVFTDDDKDKKPASDPPPPQPVPQQAPR